MRPDSRMTREDCLWQMIWNEIVKVVDSRGNPASRVASPVRKTKPASPASNTTSSTSKRKAARTRKTTRTWTVSDVLLKL